MSNRVFFEALYAINPGDESIELVTRPCIEINEGVITGFSPGCPPGTKKLPVAVLPGLCNAHLHLLDYAIAETGENKRLEDLVELPRGLKYRLLSRLSLDTLEERLSIAATNIRNHGTLFLGVYAELGQIGASLVARVLDRYRLSFRVLVQPNKKVYAEYKELLERYGGVGLDTVFDLSSPELVDLVQLARRVHGYVHVHVSETRELYEKGDYKVALEAKPHAAVHLTMLGADELMQVAREGIDIIFCPRSNMYHTGRLPRLDLLPELVAETNVALGTDNAAWIPPFVAEEASYAYLSVHPVSRSKARELAEALLLSITSSCVRLLGLWSKEYDSLSLGASLVLIPELSWSNDPVTTIIKRMQSYKVLGAPPGEATRVIRELLGEEI